jgi:uncharacterized protein (DUF2252 family)
VTDLLSDDTGISVDDRHEQGRAARKAVPRSSHAEWAPPTNGRDPVQLIEAQNADRLAFLVPVRRGRMSVSPFAFYRGAARIMAHDLAATPISGLTTQICGDAHLANFGFYASPERQLVFDTNDFDETLPGPWEWDVKRMAASFTIAARHRDFPIETVALITQASVASYRQAMLGFARMRTLDLWYDHMSTDELNKIDQTTPKATRKTIGKIEQKARTRDSLQALRKLTVVVDGDHRIRSDPPVLVPMRDLDDELRPAEFEKIVLEALETYKSTLSDERHQLLDRFRPVDTALKVVGVGSVGTRCFILLLEGRDRDDPLFLQVKEATTSVLEEHLPASAYDNHGRRVVEGQRSMQAVSDIFLGWTEGREGRQFYGRQLRDWKGSVDLETIGPGPLGQYANLCGWTLARGHARTGDPIAIAAYLGTSAVFDRAVTEFSSKYAEQNDADFAAFTSKIDSGELAVDREV